MYSAYNPFSVHPKHIQNTCLFTLFIPSLQSQSGIRLTLIGGQSLRYRTFIKRERVGEGGGRGWEREEGEGGRGKMVEGGSWRERWREREDGGGRGGGRGWEREDGGGRGWEREDGVQEMQLSLINVQVEMEAVDEPDASKEGKGDATPEKDAEEAGLDGEVTIGTNI